MRKINRRGFFTLIGAIVPSFIISKAEALPAFSLTQAGNSPLGAFLTESSNLKVGKSLVFTGKDDSGRTIEVILTRTKKAVVALDGTCTHQGCTVALKKISLVCPCHGSVFQASTGAVLLGPNGSSKNTISPLARYKVTEKSGKIYIS